jgi:cytoplasmic iron level regulating protein YaaA (DUF328/UPF0246 family)
MVKVTFIAKEEGFYKIVLSNSHSWMRAKTLMFRYVILKPVDSSAYVKDESVKDIGKIAKDKGRQLDVKILDKS